MFTVDKVFLGEFSYSIPDKKPFLKLFGTNNVLLSLFYWDDINGLLGFYYKNNKVIYITNWTYRAQHEFYGTEWYNSVIKLKSGLIEELKLVYEYLPTADDFLTVIAENKT